MNRDELASLVRESMSAEFYERPGSVLYSSLSAIRPFPVYVMGLNPGGDPAGETRPLVEALAPADGTSFYTHDCWQKSCKGGDCEHKDVDGSVRKDALRPHQKAMISLAELFGTTPPLLPSANAIFGRSSEIACLHSETGHSLDEWWEACWPVHQRLLQCVRPRIIIALGKGERHSSYALLRKQAGYPPGRTFSDEGVNGGKAFEAQLELGATDQLRCTVIGFPHPSWYPPGPILQEMTVECARGVLAA